MGTMSRRGEHARRQAVQVHPVERARPPGDEQREQPGKQHRREANPGEFRRHPGSFRHALCPRQTERPRLELACHERRAPEQSDQGRSKDHERVQAILEREVIASEGALRGRATDRACRHAGVEEVRDMGAGDCEDDRHDSERRERDDRRESELSPREPDHLTASNVNARSRACPTARPM